MLYRFSKIVLLLSAILCASINAFEISEDVSVFLKQKVLPSCTKLPKHYDFIEAEYEEFANEIKKVGYEADITYYPNRINSYLKEYSCDERAILEFNIQINHDLIPAHQAEMARIKKEIDLFRKKNLSASVQISKYLSYKNEHYLTDDDLDATANLEVTNLALLVKNSAKERERTCSNVMNLKYPLSVEKPKNQDTIGWCYAYTASDLIAHAIGKNPSAVYIAMLENNRFWNRVFGETEGGHIETALGEMIEKGICLEEDMPSTDYQFSQEGKDLGQVFNRVLELRRDYIRRSFNTQLIMNNLCSENLDLFRDLHQVFPGLNMAELGSILTKGSATGAFKRIVNKSCKISRDDDLKSLKVQTEEKTEKIFSTIDEQLNKGNILGIGYKSAILTNSQANSQANSRVADHASSIVGRRFNPKTNTCEYLVRNSEGKACATYSKDYECNNGHIWIGEEFFNYNNAISKVVYVQKK